MKINSVYKNIILIFLGWTAFAFFFALQGYTGNLYLGQTNSFWSLVAVWLISGYAWLILMPVVLFISKRFTIQGEQIRQNLIIHLCAAIALSLIHLSLIVIFRHLFLRGIDAPFTFTETFQRLLLSNVNFDFLVYWILVGVLHLREINRRYLERERETAKFALQTSQLETRLAQSQLNILKMQLHPHFLFNTLNSISVLMRDDVKAANNMLVRLSELLRFALKSGNIQEIPLKDEIEFIRSYLEIEQIRFQERLTVDFKIEPETLDAKIPNLILQPIIENAIRHGIAPMAKAGKVSITSCLQNGFVELCVADNGAGISVSKTVSNGIGLKNTQERLERLYGKRHKFEIISDKNPGFSVKIVIPYHQYEQQNTSPNR